MTFEEFIRKGIVSGATQFTFEPAPAYDKCVIRFTSPAVHGASGQLLWWPVNGNQVFDMDNVLKDEA